MSERLLRAIRLRRACWRLLDRDVDGYMLARTVCEAEKATYDLDPDERAAYHEFLMSDRETAAILERARTGAKDE